MRAPASAASAEPIAKLRYRTLTASTPKLSAMRASDTVARQPTPILVRVMKEASRIKQTVAATMMSICAVLTVRPRNSCSCVRIGIACKGQTLLAESDTKSVLHEHQETDRGDHRHVGRVVEEGLIDQAINRHSEECCRRRGRGYAKRDAAGIVRHDHRYISAES